jgi:hypothetical protein
MKGQRKKHPWYRHRGYLHFDCPVKLSHANRIVSNPEIVAKHAFYPFITYEMTSKKIIYNNETDKFTKKIKERPIAYASHIDAHIYSFYGYNLNEKYDQYVKDHDIHENVLAFRKLNKCNINFANDAFNEIIKMGNCVALAFDISKFFDTLIINS